MKKIITFVEPQFSGKISGIEKVLSEQDLTETFKKYTPSEKTGYAFDNSDLITTIKQHVIIEDNHSDSSFNVSCSLLKKKLNSK